MKPRKLVVLVGAAVVLLVATAVFAPWGQDTPPAQGDSISVADTENTSTYLVTSGRVRGTGTGSFAGGNTGGNIHCSGEVACSVRVPSGTASLEATFEVDAMAASANLGIRQPNGTVVWSEQGNVIIQNPEPGEYFIRASPLGAGSVVYGSLIQLTPENATKTSPPIWLVGHEMLERSWCTHSCSFVADEPLRAFWYLYGEGLGGRAVLTHEDGSTVEMFSGDVVNLTEPGAWTLSVEGVSGDQVWWFKATDLSRAHMPGEGEDR